MTRLVSALAIGLVAALAVPVSAQQPPAKAPAPTAAPAAEAPKTKEECEKMEGMRWRNKRQQCVKAKNKAETKK